MRSGLEAAGADIGMLLRPFRGHKDHDVACEAKAVENAGDLRAGDPD